MLNPSAVPSPQLFSPLSDELVEAVNLIEQAHNWQDKYRQIMLLGKLIPPLAVEFKQADAQVKGCESQAWLYHYMINGQHFYIADSDARIVKGLMGLLLVACQGKSTNKIQQFDVKQYFARFGLSGQLSPSRTNGLTALAQAIVAYTHDVGT
ncbi:SufE family protein [Shewanella livingstonensis]|uniref:SufE family protein n=1 Tax=Shewanella livingstonensis TaxID=150120 RepID=A0A3G8LTR1_9GAMM|nr:SufE family protein [Shewanella livingstonensis]AZG72190.1 SufE family protein [Shewanella livingstonensis]